MNSKFGECCNCPVLEDGRFFTEYRDRDALQFNIMKSNNLTNSNQFREFLIKNGTTLMANNTKVLEDSYKCNYNNKIPVTTSPIDAGRYLNGVIQTELTDNRGVF